MAHTILTIALITQLIAGNDDFPKLREHFGLGTAQTYYVLVIDGSADPNMKNAWSTINQTIQTVHNSVDSNSSFSVILFSEDASLIYSGRASQLALTSFPNIPSGRHTDWGKALEKVYEICSRQNGVGIVFTLSVCCVEGIDTRSTLSPYQDTTSPAWIALKKEFEEKGRDIYFVPVIIPNGISTYTDLIRFTVGIERVLSTSVNLYDLKNRIEEVKNRVMEEALRKLVADELKDGNIQLKYELKGNEKERLFISNNYRFLPVQIKKVDSISGRFFKLKISDKELESLNGLIIPPRSTVKIEKKHLKGPRKERWDYSLATSGMWFYFHEIDNIVLHGSLTFDAEKEINDLNLCADVKTEQTSVEIKKINWATVGGGFGLMVVVILFLAFKVGVKSSNKKRI